MTTTSLFGKLREHELEMNMLNDQEHEEKHVRSIALKVVGHRDGQESSEDKKHDIFNANNYTCFGCGKQGHTKADCPNNESKER